MAIAYIQSGFRSLYNVYTTKYPKTASVLRFDDIVHKSQNSAGKFYYLHNM